MEQQDTHQYDDIINLPHHVSTTRPRMSRSDRAAQFSPFAAPTVYGAAILETERLTDEKIELDESPKDALDERLQLLREALDERPVVSITYFKPDERKTGGSYETASGTVKKIDEIERVLVMTDGTQIPIEEIYAVE